MKKIYIVLFLLFFSTLFLFSISYADDEKVPLDLVNYVNQGLLNIAELEKRSLEQYSSVIGENFTTEERVYKALKDDVIPLYKRFVDLLREISPKTKEVRKVHRIYIRGAEFLYDGFKLKMLGLEKKDNDIVIMANKKIEKGREEVKRWRLELIELYKKHGVAEEKAEDSKE